MLNGYYAASNFKSQFTIPSTWQSKLVMLIPTALPGPQIDFREGFRQFAFKNLMHHHIHKGDLSHNIIIFVSCSISIFRTPPS